MSKGYWELTEAQREVKRARMRAYDRAHKKEAARYMKKYHRVHRKEKAAAMRRYRARKRANPFDWSKLFPEPFAF